MGIDKIIEAIGGFGVGNIFAVVFVLFSLIQITPIKINPWSKLFKWIGGILNGEVMKEIKDIKKDLNAVREDFERDKAETQRNRILRFDDELRRKEDHSEEFFNQIQDDISDYLEYCNKHEKFPNGRADSAIHNIRQTYDYCKHNDKFI